MHHIVVWFLFVMLPSWPEPVEQPHWFSTEAECQADVAYTKEDLAKHGYPGSILYCDSERLI